MHTKLHNKSHLNILNTKIYKLKVDKTGFPTLSPMSKQVCFYSFVSCFSVSGLKVDCTKH